MISPRFRLFRWYLLLFLAMSATCIKSPSEPAIQEPSTITLSSNTFVLTAIGQRIRIDATVLDQDSKVITDATIFWRSGSDAIATVSESGVVTAVAMGTTQINVSSGYATASATVTVEQAAGRIEIRPTSATLERAGETVQLVAEVFDTGSTAIPGAVVVWSSSNPEVATVDANGLVTAVSNGTAQITARLGSVKTLRPVYVEIMQVAVNIELNVFSATLTTVGQSLQLNALVYDIEGTAIPDVEVAWSSSHPEFATVSASGLVSAVSNGTTRVTAASEGVSTFATISVVIEGTVIGPEPEPEPGSSPDRDALIAFYNATDGPNWGDNTNWLSEEHVRDWYGVTTNARGRVVRLDLMNNGLKGPLSPELGELAELRELSISNNELTGSIPGELGDLANLIDLSVRRNQLSGPIPSEIGLLASLRYLDLERNQLSGMIPSEIGQLQSLAILSLRYNELNGTIPSEIGQLVKLQDLWLNDNQLSGALPMEIGQLADLIRLELFSNRLTGVLPPEIGQLGNLKQLWLQDNMLTGSVPPETGQLASLGQLYLSGNVGMAGPLPLELTGVPLQLLRLNDTQLCAPLDATFQAWLAGINDQIVENCAPTTEPTPDPDPEPDPDPAVDRIEIESSPATLTLRSVGATVRLSAKVYDADNEIITGATVTWESNNPLVATVDTNGLVTAVAHGSATITAALEGKSDSATISVELTGARIEIELSKDKLTSVGATEQLSAKVYDSNENVIADAPVAWSSSDQSVATADANGLVTAVSRGNTTITATSGSLSANVVITVDLPATQIEIDPPSATLTSVGETKQLSATVYDVNDDIITGATVTWESGDTSVATVNTNGLVTAVARGSAMITAALEGKSDSAAISVELPTARVEVDPSTATLTSVGATKQLTAKVFDTNDDIIADASVAWTSDDPSVATVNRMGLVTAIGSGATTITATSDSKSDSATISVELTGARIEIVLSSDKLTSVDATEQLSAKVYDSNENVIADAPVAWTSSDPSVATVDANGLVTAVSRGNTKITATSGSLSANVVIKVDLPAARVVVDPDSETLTSVGETEQLTATVYDVNNDVIEDATVAWESDDTSVATVSTSGLVTAVARGTTTITATSESKSATASITVDLPADQIDIDPDSETLTSVGATVQLTATVYDENNDVIEDATVAWESDDTSVATVSTSGLVTAVARGTPTITATSGDKSKTASITVDLPAARIDVDPSSHTLTSVGATKQLTVTVYDANNDIITGAAVTWESGDTNVATVNANGLVTAVADGSTNITATSGGESDSATITVDLPDGSIEIDPSSATLTAVADTVQLTATVYDANDDIVSGATVTWTSGTTSVATVSASGLVTAVARGSTTITATSGSVSDEAAITVDLPAKRIDIDPDLSDAVVRGCDGAAYRNGLRREQRYHNRSNGRLDEQRLVRGHGEHERAGEGRGERYNKYHGKIGLCFGEYRGDGPDL